MFPIHHKKGGAGHAEGTSSEAKNYGIPFLDRVVNLDTATVTHRDSNAAHQLAVMRDENAPDRGDYSHIAHAGSKLTSKDLSGAEGSRISVVIVQDPSDDRGKTVRQLSRLWRYMDGADPDIQPNTIAINHTVYGKFGT